MPWNLKGSCSICMLASSCTSEPSFTHRVSDLQHCELSEQQATRCCWVLYILFLDKLKLEDNDQIGSYRTDATCYSIFVVILLDSFWPRDNNSPNHLFAISPEWSIFETLFRTNGKSSSNHDDHAEATEKKIDARRLLYDEILEILDKDERSHNCPIL